MYCSNIKPLEKSICSTWLLLDPSDAVIVMLYGSDDFLMLIISLRSMLPPWSMIKTSKRKINIVINKDYNTSQNVCFLFCFPYIILVLGCVGY